MWTSAEFESQASERNDLLLFCVEALKVGIE